MKYNDAIANQYGKFNEISIGETPLKFSPTPTDRDYSVGSFTRTFCKKINEDLITEIKSEQVGRINNSLYKIVYVNWVISGLKEARRTNGILEQGVVDVNRSEIDRIRKEESVDLSKALPNLLEYWRGH